MKNRRKGFQKQKLSKSNRTNYTVIWINNYLKTKNKGEKWYKNENNIEQNSEKLKLWEKKIWKKRSLFPLFFWKQ